MCQTLHGLQDVHDCLEKKLLRSSVLPNFRQSMEYRAFIQLQAQNTARRSSGGDDPNGKQHTQVRVPQHTHKDTPTQDA